MNTITLLNTSYVFYQVKNRDFIKLIHPSFQARVSFVAARRTLSRWTFLLFKLHISPSNPIQTPTFLPVHSIVLLFSPLLDLFSLSLSPISTVDFPFPSSKTEKNHQVVRTTDRDQQSVWSP